MSVAKLARALLVVLALTASACGPYHRAAVATPPATSEFAPATSAVTTAPSPTRTHHGGHASPSAPPITAAPPTPAPRATHVRQPSPEPQPTQPSPTQSSPTPAQPAAGPDLSAYRGLGTWVDIYDNDDAFGPLAFGDPAAWAAAMRRDGVRTVFLEAGSYRHPPVEFPDQTTRFIRAAHANGLRVIAWYLPLFRSVAHDLAETMRVIRFRTPDGQGYDGFAMDIEAAIVPPQQRISNFLQLSAMVRAEVGPSYALGAIIPSPSGLIRVPSYWPGFPYSQLERYFDVILPMSYFTFHEHGAAAVAQYVRDNVEIIRRETGDPNVPVHVIGGIADDMTPDETVAFVQAAREEHVFGASLYEFPRTSAFQWRTLAPLR